MRWHLSDRADPRAASIADRHYSRQKIGTPQFVPPGRCLVLLTEKADALWITSFPFAQFVRHAWAGAWVCSCFRNESMQLSSELIVEVVAATRWYGLHMDSWNCATPPEPGFITFVNTSKVKSTNPGCCYKKAGWHHVGETKGGLVALQLLPNEMPEPIMPIGARVATATQLNLFDEVA